MKHLYATSYRPYPRPSRPNGSPAYYQGRPASVWINASRPRRGRGQRSVPVIRQAA
jgi:hypothetical protein